MEDLVGRVFVKLLKIWVDECGGRYYYGFFENKVWGEWSEGYLISWVWNIFMKLLVIFKFYIYLIVLILVICVFYFIDW